MCGIDYVDEQILVKDCMRDFDEKAGFEAEVGNIRLQRLHDVVKASLNVWVQDGIKRASFKDCAGYIHYADEYGNYRCMKKDGTVNIERKYSYTYDPAIDVHGNWRSRYVNTYVSLNGHAALSDGTIHVFKRDQVKFHSVIAMMFDIDGYEALFNEVALGETIVANHMDNCHWHNQVSNLEWTTKSMNTSHACFIKNMAKCGEFVERFMDCQVVEGRTFWWLRAGISAKSAEKYYEITADKAIKWYESFNIEAINGWFNGNH